MENHSLNMILGIEGYKYLTAEKVGMIPSIAEQILEMVKEQETITVGPDDYDVLDKDGNVIYEGSSNKGSKMIITGKKICHRRIQSKKIRVQKTVVLIQKMF